MLDVGSGEGTCAREMLRLGARVTAIDISAAQLRVLEERCKDARSNLTVVCDDVWQALDKLDSFDAVIFDSFLHHVPNYLELLAAVDKHLEPRAAILTFQDPLRYDTLSRTSYVMSNGAYFAWRVLQGNLVGGLKTRIRRLRGVYIPGHPADDAEYHVTRNGLDQDEMARQFRSRGFATEVTRYFSTQSAMFQALGAHIGVENTFSILARRG